MSFEFDYEPLDERSTPSPRPPDRRSGSSGLWRRLSSLWRSLPRPGRIAVVAVLVLAMSTVITSRDRRSDQLSVEDIAATVPPVETDPAPTTRPTRAAPAVTQQPSVEPEPSPTQPPPATAAAPTIHLSPTVDWAELALSVVYVEAGECPSLPSDMFSSGSGTVVLNGGYVLTNAHVVIDDGGLRCRDLVVWFTNSFEEEPSDWALANLVAADRSLDLAVLQLSEPVSAGRSIEVTEQQLEPGEAIRILGYPGVGGLTITLTRGAYSGLIAYDGETYIKTDAYISEGSSGGAAFNEAGVFIGVPTAGIEDVGHLIPAGTAMKFLEQVYGS